ncbi:MAG: aldo/keto reductase [Armatimonadota bacterium]|nr:aldo/keto reductase [Armatimonadota bacterium]
MQYREFGRTGVKLSALGFGAMRLPQDEDYAVRVIHRAFELGVNYIDTAPGYGESERICGKALKGWRDRVYVSTKNPLHDNTVDGWWRRLEASLKALDVECIDFYQVIHSIRWQNYEEFLLNAGGMKAVRQAQEQGLIKHVCFSSHDTPENIIKLIDTGEFEGMTVQYNLLDRKNEVAIAHANASGMGVVIMGPVGGGRLAAPSEKIRKMIPTPVASNAEIALRFVLANPNVTCALSGMNTIEMVEENAAVASREEALTLEEKKAIEAALAELQKLSDLYCTGCRYCMPCPYGVNIPENFRIMNLHRLYGLTDYARRVYKSLSNPERPNRGKRAEDCVQCGQCEPKCPQNIPIRQQLKEVARELGSQ